MLGIISHKPGSYFEYYLSYSENTNFGYKQSPVCHRDKIGWENILQDGALHRPPVSSQSARAAPCAAWRPNCCCHNRVIDLSDRRSACYGYGVSIWVVSRR